MRTTLHLRVLGHSNRAHPQAPQISATLAIVKTTASLAYAGNSKLPTHQLIALTEAPPQVLVVKSAAAAWYCIPWLTLSVLYLPRADAGSQIVSKLGQVNNTSLMTFNFLFMCKTSYWNINHDFIFYSIVMTKWYFLWMYIANNNDTYLYKQYFEIAS